MLALVAAAACCAFGASTAAAAPTTSASALHAPRPTLVLTDADNGRTVGVRAGTRVTVSLGSTYWTFEGSSNPLVLAQVGTVTVTPTAGCVPGAGCGTARARFAARLAGRAAVTASRTTCGEALACVGSSGRFTVTLVVRGRAQLTAAVERRTSRQPALTAGL